jgi:hypothetical protein
LGEAIAKEGEAEAEVGAPSQMKILKQIMMTQEVFSEGEHQGSGATTKAI